MDRKSQRSPSHSDKRDQTRSDMSKSDRIRKSSSTSSSNKEHGTKPKVSKYLFQDHNVLSVLTT